MSSVKVKEAPAKLSGERLDYDFIMDDLLELGEEATAMAVTLTGKDAAAVLADTELDLPAATIKCWVEGGTRRKQYKLACLMTTDRELPDHPGVFRTYEAVMTILILDI